MPALVTPELTIQRLSSKAELEAWVNARSIHWKLRGNLSQLLGLDPLPAGRTRHQATRLFIAADSSKDTQQVRSPRRLITLSHSNVHSSHPELTSPAMYLLRLALSLCHPTTTRSIAVHPARRRSAQSSPQFPMSGRSDARGTCTP